eukprot:CAMPEP_0117673744 /NCGR_PEP_ID=MMETSP0804-20121206/14645_1 /TAXON_ID=1074897 /ORGANISM="Tetraselmis astigmatica, Strain CCMP880" /LENGTH=515 /DNA_ID=CAMNT_0005482521 /DNA_START=1 /DNA_END=1548 /DNA_ORIENTATION=+
MPAALPPQPYTPLPAAPPPPAPDNAASCSSATGATPAASSAEPAAPVPSTSNEAEVANLLCMLNASGGQQQEQEPTNEEEEAAKAEAAAAPLLLEGPTPSEASRMMSRTVEEQEQADLDAAIAASLQDVPGRPQSWMGSSGDLAGAAAVAEGLPQLALGLEESQVAAGVGLRNDIGEYNCFLNVIVQCLWHLSNFRHSMLTGDPQVHDANDVVRALYHLFQAFDEVDKRSKATATAGMESAGKAAEEQGAAKRVVSPTELREALSAVEGQQIFRLGEMNDASEVLAVLWACMQQAHEQAYQRNGRSSRPWRSLALVDEMFGLQIHEVMICKHCHKETRKTDYLQYRQTVPAMALRLQAAAEGAGVSMGALVQAVMRSHHLPCDPDEGGCGVSNAKTIELQRPPGVLTLELAWATERAPPDDISATLAAVDDHVDLGEIYSGVGPPGQHLYRLRSMVCYYGSHYQAIVLSPDLDKWLIFDDESISVIGSWEAAKAKCLVGRIQPSVLFYELKAADG